MPPLSPRDDQVLEFCQHRICVERQLRRFFPSRRICSRRLAALRAGGWLRTFGRLRIDDTGPNQYVYGNGWKPSSPRHDVLVTDVADALGPPEDFDCHPQRVDQHLLPDFEFTLPQGLRVFGELDLATEPLAVIAAKNARYGDVCDPVAGPIVVYITVGKRRLRNLASVAGPIANAAYFTTLRHLMEQRRSARYVRCDGQQVVLFSGPNPAPIDVPHPVRNSGLNQGRRKGRKAGH